jgi:hypothetical protein
MKINTKLILVFILLILKHTFIYSQENKLKQELSAGGNIIYISTPFINNILVKQNLPNIKIQFEGIHINYSIYYKKYLFRTNIFSGKSDNLMNSLKNKCNLNSYGLNTYYRMISSSSNSIYFGLSIKASVLQSSIVYNQIQDIQNLKTDRILLFNNNFSFGANLLNKMFENSKFPLILELGYCIGLNSSWNIENTYIYSIKNVEKYNTFLISIDIPFGNFVKK